MSDQPIPVPPSPPMAARSWGVYCYALTLEDNWFTVTSLMEVFSEKRDGLTTTLNELVLLGLIEPHIRHDRSHGNLVRRGYQVVGK